MERPVTPYLQWEMQILRIRVEAGEVIGVLPAEAVAPLETEAELPELVVLGSQTMYEVLYDATGTLDSDTPREHMYVNLVVSQWAMEYELRTIAEEHLRSIAHVLFSGPAGRRSWRNVRDLRVGNASSRRERRFHQILDEEFRGTDEAPRPVPAPPARRGTRPLAIVLALMAVTAAAEAVRRLLTGRWRRQGSQRPGPRRFRCSRRVR